MQVLARYTDSGKWGYIRVRLSDGRIIPEHRFVVECHLNRRLSSNEHVHHRDEDKHNNALDNLELLTNAEHGARHAIPATEVELQCPHCGATFRRKARYVRSKQNQGVENFFCGNSCTKTFYWKTFYWKKESPQQRKLNCPICNKAFNVAGNIYRLRVKRSKTGKIACSRSCGQKLGALVKQDHASFASLS